MSTTASVEPVARRMKLLFPEPVTPITTMTAIFGEALLFATMTRSLSAMSRMLVPTGSNFMLILGAEFGENAGGCCSYELYWTNLVWAIHQSKALEVCGWSLPLNSGVRAMEYKTRTWTATEAALDCRM